MERLLGGSYKLVEYCHGQGVGGSAELHQILKQKAVRSPTQNMKGYAALIKPSEFDWSEAKLSCYGATVALASASLLDTNTTCRCPSTDGFVPSCAAGR